MKKLTFLLLAMVFLFMFVLASTAAIANESVRNRDGPVTAVQPEITALIIEVQPSIVIAKALIIALNSAPYSNSAMEAWAQIARTENNLSITIITTNTVASVRLPFTIVSTDVYARPMKLPLQQSGRTFYHLIIANPIANHGRISYHHRA